MPSAPSLDFLKKNKDQKSPDKSTVESDHKEMMGPNRKFWKNLTEEQKEELKKAMEEGHAAFNRILHNMPKSLFLILR